MKRLWFKVELKDEVTAGAGTAIQGALSGLDYLPGNLFLGVAATAIYRGGDRSESETMALFHSGRVRFSNGWPLSVAGTPGLPVPRCWATSKREDFYDRKTRLLYEGKVANQVKPVVDNRPVKSLRKGYIDRYGHYIKPKLRSRLKTAIDPETGRAAEAQLFGYDSLDRGQCFSFFVELDDDLEGYANLLRETLLGEQRLGRSRSAEYGRVDVQNLDKVELLPAPTDMQRKEIQVWLLSDMAVEDEWGMPAELPRPEDLGLESATFVPERSFITTRRAAPYNGHYQAHEQERLLLTQGSVLTWRLEDAIKVPEGLAWGGLFRQCGYGLFCVNSPLLDFDFAAYKPESTGMVEDVRPVTPPDPLAHWLIARHKGSEVEQYVRSQAEKWKLEMDQIYRSARNILGYTDNEQVGPSPAQWGRIRDFARDHLQETDKGFLIEALFGPEPEPGAPDEATGKRNTAICRYNDPDWQQRILYDDLQRKRADHDLPNFRDWLRYRLDQEQHHAIRILARFARYAADSAGYKGGRP